MPRENRKRGKKNKKRPEEDVGFQQNNQTALVEPELSEPTGEPSWLHSASAQAPEFNPEAPFGYVDADVKAYFRTVDVQMRDWQEGEQNVGEEDQDTDPNEERRFFFVAALTEMGGKEKQLSTDPDCSVILERMSYSMDDFVRRVFVDSLTGSFETLVRHRFASHVCQTLFTVAKDTIFRESRGIFPTVPETSDQGELRTLTQLVIDAAEELLPAFSSLIMDPFASHVIRALLILLSPSLAPSENSVQQSLRSKKSAAWKAKQGPMKSVFVEGKRKEKEMSKLMPPELQKLARRFVEVIQTELNGNEVRALAANKVASPSLQMLLEVEADQGMAADPDSLMDRVTVGIVTACNHEKDPKVEQSDYLNTLLRDPTSSHLLETIVACSPVDAFAVLWTTYFKGKLARLAIHPVANFVFAKALERVSSDQLSEICEELQGSWGKMIRLASCVLWLTVVPRFKLRSKISVMHAVYSAFDLVAPEDYSLLVPCEYKAALGSEPPAQQYNPSQKGGRPGPSSEVMEPKIQGSVLLQSLLRLPAPYNQIVIGNIASLSIEDRIKIAHNTSGSRVYDVLLEAPTVPPKAKCDFVMGFIGHYHILVDDRLGSRVGDRCWAFADTYLKEKIARSLFVHEQFLAGSYFGKFFARNLNLHLLQRRPDEWKTMQADKKRTQEQTNNPPPVLDAAPPSTTPTSQKHTKRKRKAEPEDEIDAVFKASLGKRIKKAALGEGELATAVLSDEKVLKEQGLQYVLGAIKRVPKNERGHKAQKT
ncbi:hypothetical protein H0H81_002263 [Sphagnurus paluster]|uniref:Nucleolar protein 9 n=1 Tax=Sphagnurus paluster TaxID=117069 RepID=A0A9P7FMA0_9AGAR|nr:hypothetical protein H0H81_002263 [Sphagnurus paluster]